MPLQKMKRHFYLSYSVTIFEFCDDGLYLFYQFVLKNKFMRTKLPSLLCIICLSFIFIPNTNAQFGLRAGISSNGILARDQYKNDLYNYARLTTGFNAGVTYDIPINDKFSVQPILQFSKKGYWVKYVEENYSNESWFSPYYMELPINVLFKPSLGNGKLITGAGAYIACGMGGKGHNIAKYIVNEELITSKDNARLAFIRDFNDLDADKWAYGKPLDYGVQLLEGYELKNGFSLQLMAQLGLANIYANADGEKPVNSKRNYGINLSIGYRL